jgi:sec-independent protein translocase protein TatB
MFDFDAGKMIVFGIVALAVIPPKDLPRVMRTVGKYVGQMRRMASDFQGQFMEAMKEAELDSVKKEIAEINAASKIDPGFDANSLMRDHIERPVEAAASEAKPEIEATPYETIHVEAPQIAPAEPLAVEIPHREEKAASSAT